jgi:hypothetical protein
VSFVSGVRFDPSAFINQMFREPFVFAASVPLRAREDVKRIFVPPGVHTGISVRTEAVVNLVKAVGLEPSAFITQMF